LCESWVDFLKIQLKVAIASNKEFGGINMDEYSMKESLERIKEILRMATEIECLLEQELDQGD